jgi:hypothetical protein
MKAGHFTAEVGLGIKLQMQGGAFLLHMQSLAFCFHLRTRRLATYAMLDGALKM